MRVFAAFAPTSFGFRRWIIPISLALIVVATVTIAGNRKADPLVAEIEQFEKKVDSFFRPQVKDESLLSSVLESQAGDRTLEANSKPLLDLQLEFEKMKKRIEAVSVERKEFSVDDAWIKSLAEVAARYHAQQKRLYSNNFRLAHQRVGQEHNFIPHLYDRLNLELHGPVGVELVMNDALKMKFSVSHIRNIVKGSYERVSVGVNATDKDQLEQEVLQSVQSEKSYAKLIHFMSTRSRIMNHFALQRISPPGSLSDPSLNSCGENLVSFKHPSIAFGGEYYESLKMYDKQQELDRITSDPAFLRLAQGEPILSQDRFRALFIEFFNRLPQVDGQGGLKETMASDPTRDMEEQVQEMLHSWSAPMHKAIEEAWSKQVHKALVQSSFYADDWSPQLMVDRMTYVAFQAKKDLVIHSFFGEIKKQNLDFTAGGDEKLLQLATSVLEKELDQAELAWRRNLNQKLSQFLTSQQGKSITWHQHEQNFQDLYKMVWPVVQYGAEAYFVRDHADQVRKAEVEKFVDRAWKDDPKAFHTRWSAHILNAFKYTNPITAFVGRPTQYYAVLNTLQKQRAGGMVIPARGYLKKRVAPWTPDQLSQYFFKKLDFWKTQDQFTDLKKRAEAIEKNKTVMKALDYFFEQLSEDFHQRLTQVKLSKSDLRPGSEFMYQNMTRAAQAAEQALYSLMETQPELPKATPQATPYVRPLNPAVSTAIKKPIQYDLVQKPETDYVAPWSRSSVAELFYDAMSMMGLARPAFNKVSFELIPTRFSMRSFLKIESLFDDGGGESRLPYRVAMSVLDQQLLADTIYGMAMAEQPILAIQFENKSKSPPVLEIIAKNYSLAAPLSLSGAETQIRAIIRTAIQNQGSLVAEACQAKPFQDYNSEWRNLFRSSTSVRGILKSVNPHFAKYDDAIMKSTRTQWERLLEDFLDPAAQWFFYAFGAAMIVVAVFTGGVGLAGMAAVGRAWGWQLGKGVLIRAFGRHAIKKTLATTILAANQSMLKKVGGTLVGKLVYYLFTVQILTMGYVNLVELPPHVKYQLGVANSEIGIGTKVTADRRAIREMADQLHAKKIMTVAFLALQATQMRPFFNDIKTLTGGRLYKKNLERLGAVEGGDDILKEMRSKSYIELYREKGFVSGTQAWFKQSAESFKKTLHFSAVSANATKQQALNLIQKQIQRMFPSKEAYVEIIEARIAHINKLGAQAKKVVLNSRTQTGRADQMKDWIRSNIARYLLKGKYWDVAMSESAKKGVTVVLQNGKTTVLSKNHDVWEFTIVAYMDELLQTRTYWEQRLKVLNTIEMDLVEGAIEGKTKKDLLGHYFSTQTADDVMRHEELFDWTLRQTSGGPAQAWIKKQLGTTQGIRDFRNMFKDYRVVVREIDNLNPPPRTAGADEAADAAAGMNGFGAPASDLGDRTLESGLQVPKTEGQTKELPFGVQDGQPVGSKPSAESVKNWNVDEATEILYVDLDAQGNPIIKPMQRSVFEKAKQRLIRVFQTRFNLGRVEASNP